MMKKVKIIIAVLAIVTLIAGLSACNEGPLERAGKKVDNAVDDLKK